MVWTWKMRKGCRFTPICFAPFLVLMLIFTQISSIHVYSSHKKLFPPNLKMKKHKNANVWWKTNENNLIDDDVFLVFASRKLDIENKLEKKWEFPTSPQHFSQCVCLVFRGIFVVAISYILCCTASLIQSETYSQQFHIFRQIVMLNVFRLIEKLYIVNYMKW